MPATDPVCKMHVVESNPPGGKAKHQGKTYYFCGPGCEPSFEQNPTKYVA